MEYVAEYDVLAFLGAAVIFGAYAFVASKLGF